MKLTDLFPVKLAWRIVIGLVVTGLLFVVVYRLFFQGQDLAREKGNRIVAEEQNTAEGQIVDNTMKAIRSRDIYREHTTTIVRESREEINNAWTGETVGQAVDAAGADALCRMHDDLCRPSASPGVQSIR
jgi:predicted metalloprotease